MILIQYSVYIGNRFGSMENYKLTPTATEVKEIEDDECSKLMQMLKHLIEVNKF